ncbi:MAG: nucleoside monophosphate kinase [Alphaproteobacteria bacterium]|nr:nucleoside monophosphate kinase [Alphaproteobacteria bacterium]
MNIYHLIFIGGPNSGKGTNIKLTQELFKTPFNYLGTGNLIRNEIASGSELGQTVNAIVQRGDLVDDATVYKIVEKYINSQPLTDNYILDGWPRDMHQADEYLALRAKMEKELNGAAKIQTIIIEFDISEEVVRKYAEKRAREEGRKDDADINIVLHRMELYKSVTLPIIDYLRRHGAPVHTLSSNENILTNPDLYTRREEEIKSILKSYGFDGFK